MKGGSRIRLSLQCIYLVVFSHLHSLSHSLNLTPCNCALHCIAQHVTAFMKTSIYHFWCLQLCRNLFFVSQRSQLWQFTSLRLLHFFMKINCMCYIVSHKWMLMSLIMHVHTNHWTSSYVICIFFRVTLPQDMRVLLMMLCGPMHWRLINFLSLGF